MNDATMVSTTSINLKKKVRAIVMFGPATSASGMRPAEYYQVIVDLNMVSPDGKYIRFGHYKGDEITGWQRVEAMTICEVLDEEPDDVPMSREGYVETDGATLTMRKAG